MLHDGKIIDGLADSYDLMCTVDQRWNPSLLLPLGGNRAVSVTDDDTNNMPFTSLLSAQIAEL